jgi:ribonuclease HI
MSIVRPKSIFAKPVTLVAIEGYDAIALKFANSRSNPGATLKGTTVRNELTVWPDDAFDSDMAARGDDARTKYTMCGVENGDGSDNQEDLMETDAPQNGTDRDVDNWMEMDVDEMSRKRAVACTDGPFSEQSITAYIDGAFVKLQTKSELAKRNVAETPSTKLKPVSKTKTKTKTKTKKPAADVRPVPDGVSDIRIGSIGVWFGPGDARNVSRPVALINTSRIRAEVEAFLEAMKLCSEYGMINIFTDSEYVANYASHIESCEKAFWASLNTVAHIDLWRQVCLIFKARSRYGLGFPDVQYVKGHPGNKGAEMLAKGAAETVKTHFSKMW